MQKQFLPDTFRASVYDHRLCRGLIRQGSKSFFAASLLLPTRVRTPAYALYAFCRLADDAVDFGADRRMAVARLHDRLDRVYAGRPLSAPVDQAFAETVAQHGIPRALPEALFDGFAWDAEDRRYDTLSSVYAYAARVAGTVGAMMTMIMGRRSPDVVARACDLGVAMQLTNIARDVGEDAQAGRLYLPRQWMLEVGLDPDAWLLRPEPCDALATVVCRLLRAADDLYTRAGQGIAGLPLGCRPAINAARRIYREIGCEVARHGYDSVSRRAVVSTKRKLALALSAVAGMPLSGNGWAYPCLDETRFLVDAVVAAEPSVNHVHRGAEKRAMDEQVGWVIDLFARLEQRDRDGLAARANGFAV